MSPAVPIAPSAPAPASPSTSAVQLKAGLRGASFEVQARTLAPRAPVQRRAVQKSEPNQSMADGSVSDGNASFAPIEQSVQPPPAPGSATILCDAEDTETARGGAAYRVSELLRTRPGAGVDEILRALGDEVYARGSQSTKQLSQHFTVAAAGQGGSAAGSGAAARSAVLIANSHYTVANLPTINAATPASTLSSELAGRGFSPTYLEDVPATTIDRQWSTMIDGAASGAELVAYFGGHGSPHGVFGSDGSVFTHGRIADLIHRATARGAHIRVVLDACHSGVAATLVRTEQVNNLPERRGIGALTAGVWRSLLQSLLRARSDFVTLAHARDHDLELLARFPDAATRVRDAYRAKAAAYWDELRATYEAAACAVNLLRGTDLHAPDDIGHESFGRILQFLDLMTNEALALAAGAPRPAPRP